MTGKQRWLARLDDLFGVDLRALAAFRIGIAAIVLFDLFRRSLDLEVHYTEFGVMPRRFVLETVNRWFITPHLMNGQMWFQVLLMALGLLAALCLLLGWRTRLAAVVTWVLVASLQNRIPIITTGADAFLRMLLFWSLFLPLGARFSVDAALSSDQATANRRVFSPASIAILLQVVFVYIFTVLLKSGKEWWPDGSAIYYALSLDQMVRPLGTYILYTFKDWLKFLTLATFVFEILGPFLLFFPLYHVRTRMLTIIGFWCLHLGFFSCFKIGFFPFISSVAMIPFIPSAVWDDLGRRLASKKKPMLRIYYDGGCVFCEKAVYLFKEFLIVGPASILKAQSDKATEKKMLHENSWIILNDKNQAHVKFKAFVFMLEYSTWLRFMVPFLKLPVIERMGTWAYEIISKNRHRLGHLFKPLKFRPIRLKRSLLEHLFVTFCLILVFWWNVGTIYKKHRMPYDLRVVSWVFRLDQKWNMFAPRPFTGDGWYVIRGELKNGKAVNLLDPDKPLPWDKPKNLSSSWRSWRWRKYMRNVGSKKYKKHRSYFSGYLCRDWNRHRRGDARLNTIDFIFFKEKTLRDYNVPKVERINLWHHSCFAKSKKDAKSKKVK